jgi:hypothetical protein
MKKLSKVMLAMTLMITGGQQIFCMDTTNHFFGVALSSVIGVDIGLLNDLLKDQNYYTLKRVLKPLYDQGTTAQQLAVERWTTAKLHEGMDPFLLYMNARQLFRGAGRDDAYSAGFKDLMLCIALTSVAKEVVKSQGITVSLDVALCLKEKFRTEYATRGLSPEVLELISFEEVRSGVMHALQGLHDSDEALRALPLPYWVGKISTNFLGWHGLWWGTLTEAELNTRNSSTVLDTIVVLTKAALIKHIEELEAIDSWNKFFGIPQEVVSTAKLTLVDEVSPNPSMLASMFLRVGLNNFFVEKKD